MIGYIFNKESLQIVSKINDVTSIINNEIFGEKIVKLGDNYDYIILQEDNINIGDVIDITHLEDCRDYFLLSEDKRKIKQLEEQNNKSQDNNAQILFALMNGGLL